MRIILVSCFILIQLLNLSGQNLVRNPGMDSSNYCPTFLGDMGACEYWYNPNDNSPDYFHLCVPGLAPNNAIGWQWPRSDSAYLGFFAYGNFTPNNREYIEGNLLFPLDSGKQYCVEVYLSLADYSEAASGPIGIYFSENPIYDTVGWNLQYLQLSPQLEFPLVTDTMNWVMVSDTFTATGGERYFVIGNFRTGSTTIVDTLYPFVIAFDSYYYIDDVSVYLCDDTTQHPNPEPPPVVSQLLLYPNPASEAVTISCNFKDTDKVVFKIFDASGRLILTDQFASGNGLFTTDVSFLAQGFYMAQLIVNDQDEYDKKLVIVR